MSLFANAYGNRSFKLSKGMGSYVWDSEGNKFLDCVCGIAVNALGHNFPGVVDAIKEQSEKLIHVSNLFLIEPQELLADLLLKQTHLSSVFFTNSGTESNEGAIKFVRRYWQRTEENSSRNEIITLKQSFHGRTYASIAATGQSALQTGFGPLPKGFKHLSLDDPSSFKSIVDENTAALLFEPVLAEGGVINLTDEFVSFVRSSQKKGVKIIVDEIQTGIGRTGTLFGFQNYGLEPDVITLAKPLGGGLPLGAILLSKEISATVNQGDHGSTFGGNPVSCSAGLVVLKEVLKYGFLTSVMAKSEWLRGQLKKWIEENPDFGFDSNLLGKGMLIGIPYSKDTGEFIQACRDSGLLIAKAGPKVVRLLPPLNISQQEMEEIIPKMESAAITIS